MRIAFFVNSISSEYPRYTTTLLGLAARARDHDIYYLTPNSFVLRADDTLSVKVRKIPDRKFQKVQTFHEALQNETSIETLDVTELDVIVLRNDPSKDYEERPWAAQVGPMFSRLAADRGVLVVNDPDGLALAQNKLYLQGFPEKIRPPTTISKNAGEIRNFISEWKDGVIIKPLAGSGGKNVFKITSPDDPNINQIFEAVSEEGYLIAQAYLPEATGGDIRIFLMNGSPLERDGKFAALRRVPAEGDVRSNVHAKGTIEKVEVSSDVLEIAEAVRPKLIQDGLFLVGLDIVGDRVLEINVFTPGNLWSIDRMQGVDFSETVIMSLEQKVQMRKDGTSPLSNRELAMM